MTKAAASGVAIRLASTVAVVLKMKEPSVGSAVSSVVTIAVSPTRAPSTMLTRIAPRKTTPNVPHHRPLTSRRERPSAFRPFTPFGQQHRDGDREAT